MTMVRSLAELTEGLPEVPAEVEPNGSGIPPEQADKPANVARYARYLDDLVCQGRTCIEKHVDDPALKTGYAHAMDVIRRGRDFGLGPEKNYEVFMEHMNPFCLPEWDADHLLKKVHDWYHGCANAFGCLSVASAADAFAESETVREAVAAEAKPTAEERETDIRRERFRFYSISEALSRPKRRMAIANLIPAGASTNLFSGELGSWKSFALAEMAVTFATGVPLFGSLELLTEPGPVFLMAGENGGETLESRLPAILRHRGIEAAPDWLRVCQNVPRIRDAKDVECVKVLMRELCQKFGCKPKLIGIDTITKAILGLAAKDELTAGLYILLCDDLAYEFDCPVISIGHVSHKENADKSTFGSFNFEAGHENVCRITSDDPKQRINNPFWWSLISPVRLKDVAEPALIRLKVERILDAEGKSEGVTLEAIGEAALGQLQGAAGARTEAARELRKFSYQQGQAATANMPIRHAMVDLEAVKEVSPKSREVVTATVAQQPSLAEKYQVSVADKEMAPFLEAKAKQLMKDQFKPGADGTEPRIVKSDLAYMGWLPGEEHKATSARFVIGFPSHPVLLEESKGKAGWLAARGLKKGHEA